VEESNVAPLRLTGPGQRLYNDPRDDLAEGLRDRGLGTGYQAPPEPAEKPVKIVKRKPRGKRAKVPQVTVKQPPKPKTDRQEVVSTILELFGITLLTFGVGLIYVPAGFIVLGICILLLGIALTTNRTG
jgi:hypothetical protein